METELNKQFPSLVEIAIAIPFGTSCNLLRLYFNINRACMHYTLIHLYIYIYIYSLCFVIYTALHVSYTDLVSFLIPVDWMLGILLRCVMMSFRGFHTSCGLMP